MLFSETRVLEVSKALGVDGTATTFGGALAAIEQAAPDMRRVLDALTNHELHVLCVRQNVVPDPECPRDLLIRFLLGESGLDGQAFYLTPPRHEPTP
jgi:hypothetical protein